MKTIIVATDYTKSSEHFINYAAQLALQTKAKLFLYHAFFEPYAVTEAPVEIPTREELTLVNKIKLKSTAEKIKWQYQIEVDYDTLPLPLFEGLASEVAENGADLVVMGVHTAYNWERTLFGSNMADMIRKATFPLLIVREEVYFQPFQNMLFACDYAALTPATKVSMLQELAAIFHAQVHIVHLQESDAAKENQNKFSSAIDLDELLRNVAHSYIQIEAKNFAEGIKKAIRQLKPDLLVMAPHHHSFLDMLLNKSNTRKIVFQTKLPLLTLPIHDS